MQSAEQNLAFVLGIPRSGTTLMSVLLGKHPDVLAKGEPWLMLALESLGTTHPAHPADAALLRLATGDFLGTAAPRRLGAAARAIYGDLLAQEGKSWFVDKTPRYYLCVELLAEAFPNARFFWVVRNPLDVAASFCDTWKFDLADAIERQSDHPALIDFLFGLRALVDHAARHEVCVVRYEELAAYPEREIGRAFAYLSLDPPVRGARFGRLNGGDRFGDQKILKTTAVHARSIGSYRRTFSPEQLRIIAGGLGRDLIDELGYGETFDEIAALGPIVDRSAELRDVVSNMVSSRRQAAAEGRLQTDGAAVGNAGAADARRDAALDQLRERADRLAAGNRELVQAASVAEADRAARGAVIDDLQLRLAAAEKDRAAQLALIKTLDRQAAGLGDDLEQSRREGAERLALIEQLDSARSGLEVLLAQERSEAERQAAELNADRIARGDVIEDLKQRLQDAEAERAALKNVIKGIERDREARLKLINRATMQLKAAEEDRRAERIVRNDLEAGVQFLAAASAERLAAIEKLTADLAIANQDRDSRLAVIDAMQARLTELSSRIDENERENVARVAMIAELDGARAALQTALAQQAEAAARQLDELNEDRAARGDIIEVLTERIETLEVEHAARGDVITAIERDREARLEIIDNLQVQLVQSAETHRLEALAVRRNLTNQITLLQAAADERLVAIERLGAELAVVEHDRSARGDVIEAIERDREARLKIIDNLQVELEQSAETHRLDALAVRNNLTNQITLLRAAADERLVAIERLGGELAVVERDRAARLAVIEDLAHNAAALAATIERIEAESAERFALIEELDAARSGLVAAIEVERDEAARQLAELNQDRVARGAVIEALQADHDRAEAERHARAAELAAIERDREARLEVINAMVLTLKDAEADREESLAVRDDLTQEVGLFRDAAAERLALIERLTADLALVEADRAARGALVDELDRTLRQRDEAIAASREALEQARRERQAEQEAHGARIAEMEWRLRELHEANEALGRQWSPRLKSMLAGRR